jgi:hypothetical protein
LYARSKAKYIHIEQAAVTDIQVFSHGFLSCGGDGTVKMVELR